MVNDIVGFVGYLTEDSGNLLRGHKIYFSFGNGWVDPYVWFLRGKSYKHHKLCSGRTASKLIGRVMSKDRKIPIRKLRYIFNHSDWYRVRPLGVRHSTTETKSIEDKRS